VRLPSRLLSRRWQASEAITPLNDGGGGRSDVW